MPSSSDNVRALSRGLNILRFLNRAGAARVAEISLELKLPRSTVYRLLNTLEEEGYVVYSASNSRVRLSPLATALGDSSSMRSRLCQVAAPIIAKWPGLSFGL
jgi:IclR family mhp operon transcriptional activator